MVRLSVNVNKIATVRNSRGGAVPSVLDAVRVCVDAGAPGITVHPRADARHITAADVQEVSAWLHDVEWPRRVQHRRRSAPGSACTWSMQLKPTQCTLVPVKPGEITSQAGWSPHTPREEMAAVVRGLQSDRHPRQPLRRPGGGADSMGCGRRRRPGRALHRALRPGVRTRRRRGPRARSRSTPTPHAWPRRSAWG